MEDPKQVVLTTKAPNALTIPKLKSILAACGVVVPNKASKAEYVKLFNDLKDKLLLEESRARKSVSVATPEQLSTRVSANVQASFNQTNNDQFLEPSTLELASSISEREIFETLQKTATKHNIQIRCISTATGVAQVAAAAWIGGLILGPVGCVVGGAIGGLIAIATAREYKPLSYVLQTIAPSDKCELIKIVQFQLKNRALSDEDCTILIEALKKMQFEIKYV